MQEILIKIPDEMLEWMRNGFLDENDGKNAIDAILKGTLISKGHGKLVDVEEIKKSHKTGTYDLHKVLDKATAVIEPYEEEK